MGKTGCGCLTVIAFIVAVGLFVAVSSPDEGPSPSSPPSSARSVETNLAIIDLGKSTPTASDILPYASLLDTLSVRCEEDRTKIGDMAVRAKQLFEEGSGTSISIIGLLQELMDATEGGRAINCTETVATLVLMMD